MTDLEDTLHLLLPILERRAYAASKDDREAAARMAAIANLPIGWLFEDPRRYRDDLILRPPGAGDGGCDGSAARSGAAQLRALTMVTSVSVYPEVRYNARATALSPNTCNAIAS